MPDNHNFLQYISFLPFSDYISYIQDLTTKPKKNKG